MTTTITINVRNRGTITHDAWSPAAREAALAARKAHAGKAEHHENQAAKFRGRGQHGIAAKHQISSEAHGIAAREYGKAAKATDPKDSDKFHKNAKAMGAKAQRYDGLHRLSHIG